MSSLTIAIPAYNEEENLEWVVKDTLQTLPRYFKDYEIVVVDDGSTDRTGELADLLAKKHQQVRIVHQPNGGYSKAMLTGIRNAKKEFVAYMPADGQFLVEDMRHCFALIPENDLVLGHRGGRPDYNFYRLILSYGYLVLLWLLFGITYKDVGWVNIWRTRQVQNLKINDTRGIFLLTEIVVKFKKRGLRITEAQSYYRPRKAGEVKNAKLKVVIDTFLNALKLKLQLVTGKV